ncbi:hypothetical protein MMPV_007047 [Pyropia vietnamensis]
MHPWGVPPRPPPTDQDWRGTAFEYAGWRPSASEAAAAAAAAGVGSAAPGGADAAWAARVTAAAAVAGVPVGADADTVRAAYRRRVREVHPDLAGGEGGAFRELCAAVEVLLAAAAAAEEGGAWAETAPGGASRGGSTLGESNLDAFDL